MNANEFLALSGYKNLEEVLKVLKNNHLTKESAPFREISLEELTESLTN